MSLRILVAVDGSDNALRAVAHAVTLYRATPGAELHLLSVQIPVDSGHVRLFVSHEQLEDYYREEGLAALKSSVALLQQAGIAHTPHIAVGRTADTIVRYARDMQFDQLLIGSQGHTGLSGILLGSVADEVVKASPVPVTVVK